MYDSRVNFGFCVCAYACACIGSRVVLSVLSVLIYVLLLDNFAMVDVERGLRTTRTECAHAMRHPGSARCKLREDAQTLLLVVAPLRFTMDIIYLTMQACVTQVYVSVFVLAAVTASGENSCNACLEETAASKAAKPGSASDVAKAKSVDCSSIASPKEVVETKASKKVSPGSASGAAKPESAKAMRFMLIVVVAIALACESCPLLSLSIFSTTGLHRQLQEQARRNFESCGLGLNDSGAEGWGVLFRDGGPWHEELANVTWKGQALPTTSGRRCFSCMWELFQMYSLEAGSIS